MKKGTLAVFTVALLVLSMLALGADNGENVAGGPTDSELSATEAVIAVAEDFAAAETLPLPSPTSSAIIPGYSYSTETGILTVIEGDAHDQYYFEQGVWKKKGLIFDTTITDPSLVDNFEAVSGRDLLYFAPPVTEENPLDLGGKQFYVDGSGKVRVQQDGLDGNLDFNDQGNVVIRSFGGEDELLTLEQLNGLLRQLPQAFKRSIPPAGEFSEIDVQEGPQERSAEVTDYTISLSTVPIGEFTDTRALYDKDGQIIGYKRDDKKDEPSDNNVYDDWGEVIGSYSPERITLSRPYASLEAVPAHLPDFPSVISTDGGIGVYAGTLVVDDEEVPVYSDGSLFYDGDGQVLPPQEQSALNPRLTLPAPSIRTVYRDLYGGVAKREAIPAEIREELYNQKEAVSEERFGEIMPSGSRVLGVYGIYTRDYELSRRYDLYKRSFSTEQQKYLREKYGEGSAEGRSQLLFLRIDVSDQMHELYPGQEITVESDTSGALGGTRITFADGKTAVFDSRELLESSEEGRLRDTLQDAVFIDQESRTAVIQGENFYFDEDDTVWKKQEIGVFGVDWLALDGDVEGDLSARLEAAQAAAEKRTQEVPIPSGEGLRGATVEEEPVLQVTPRMEATPVEPLMKIPQTGGQIVIAGEHSYVVREEYGTIDGREYTHSYRRRDEKGTETVIYMDDDIPVGSSKIAVATSLVKRISSLHGRLSDRGHTYIGQEYGTDDERSLLLQALQELDPQVNLNKDTFSQEIKKYQDKKWKETNKGACPDTECDGLAGQKTLSYLFSDLRNSPQVQSSYPPKVFDDDFYPEVDALQQAILAQSAVKPSLSFTIDGTLHEITPGSYFTLIDDDTWTEPEEREFRFTGNGQLEEYVDGNWQPRTEEEVVQALSDIKGDDVANIQLSFTGVRYSSDSELEAYEEEVSLVTTPAMKVDYVPPPIIERQGSALLPERSLNQLEELPPSELSTLNDVVDGRIYNVDGQDYVVTGLGEEAQWYRHNKVTGEITPTHKPENIGDMVAELKESKLTFSTTTNSPKHGETIVMQTDIEYRTYPNGRFGPIYDTEDVFIGFISEDRSDTNIYDSQGIIGSYQDNIAKLLSSRELVAKEALAQTKVEFGILNYDVTQLESEYSRLEQEKNSAQEEKSGIPILGPIIDFVDGTNSDIEQKRGALDAAKRELDDRRIELREKEEILAALRQEAGDVITVGSTSYEMKGKLKDIGNINEARVVPDVYSGELYAVVPGDDENQYSVYSIDPATGELSPLSNAERVKFPTVINDDVVGAGVIREGTYYAEDPEVFIRGSEQYRELYDNINQLLTTPSRAEALEADKNIAEARLRTVQREIALAITSNEPTVEEYGREKLILMTENLAVVEAAIQQRNDIEEREMAQQGKIFVQEVDGKRVYVDNSGLLYHFGSDDAIDVNNKVTVDAYGLALGNVEALAFNQGSDSKVSDLSIYLNYNSLLLNALNSNGFNIDKLKRGDPAEIKKLQTLIGSTVDGKFGGNSLADLKQYAMNLEKVSTIEPIVSPDDIPPLPSPDPEFLREEYLNEIKQYLGERELETLPFKGEYYTVETDGSVTFYSGDGKDIKVASYKVIETFQGGVGRIIHQTFDEKGENPSTTFEHRNVLGEMLASQTEAQLGTDSLRLQGIDEDVVLAGGTTIDALFDNTESTKTFDVYRDAEARKQGEKKRKAYVVSHASDESSTFGVIDDGNVFDEGTITTWNPVTKNLLQKEEFSGSVGSTESEITLYGDDGKTVIGQYHADYDNKEDFGGDTGDKYGNDVIELYQGGIIVGKTTLDTNGKPTSTIIYKGDGEYLVTEYDGKGNVKKREPCSTNCNFHGNDAIAAELKENVEDFGPEDFFGTIYTITDSIKSYPAISNLIFNEAANASWYDDWVRKNDEVMAPFLGREWFPSAVCESIKPDIIPEGTAMILAPGGTYQPVASIQAEKSTDQAPILCQLNQENVWGCERKQVCLNDEFCYADQDEDGRADDPDTPLIATFYTISWGVTAPRDEALTPFIDENGVAVSFNVVIEEAVGGSACLPAATGTVRPLYREALHLSRGASLKDVITRYSEKDYGRVWIQWERAPLTRSSGILTGGVGSREVENICYPITVSNRGKVNWESLVSEGGSPASASTTDAVSLRSDGW